MISMATVDGYMNLFPRDMPGGTFTPHPLTVVYPTGELARLHGDRRAPMRPVAFDVEPEESFGVYRAVDPNNRQAGMELAGTFIDYADAYDFLAGSTPSGYRAEIKILTPGADRPAPISDRLRLVERTW